MKRKAPPYNRPMRTRRLLSPLLLLCAAARAGNHPDLPTALAAAARSGKPLIVELSSGDAKGDVGATFDMHGAKLATLVRTRFETVSIPLKRSPSLARRFGAEPNKPKMLVLGARGKVVEPSLEISSEDKLLSALETAIGKARSDDAAFAERLDAAIKAKGEGSDLRPLLEECMKRMQMEDARKLARIIAKKREDAEALQLSLARGYADMADWDAAGGILEGLSRKPAFQHAATMLQAEILWQEKGADAAIAFLRGVLEERRTKLTQEQIGEMNALAARMQLGR